MRKITEPDVPFYEEEDPYEGLPDADPEQFEGQERTKAAKAKFINALKRCGVIVKACKASGVSRPTFYTWRDDLLFMEAVKEACREYSEIMVHELNERAVRGIKTYKFEKGQLTAIYRDKGKASSQLLEVGVAAAYPATYRKRIEAGDTKQIDAQLRAELARLGATIEAEDVRVVTPARIADALEEDHLLPETVDEEGAV